MSSGDAVLDATFRLYETDFGWNVRSPFCPGEENSASSVRTISPVGPQRGVQYEYGSRSFSTAQDLERTLPECSIRNRQEQEVRAHSPCGVGAHSAGTRTISLRQRTPARTARGRCSTVRFASSP